jgi:magnesium-protoporphyrin O-methyltransferase
MPSARPIRGAAPRVCCYPDFERLLGAAADRDALLVSSTHPPRTI